MNIYGIKIKNWTLTDRGTKKKSVIPNIHDDFFAEYTNKVSKKVIEIRKQGTDIWDVSIRSFDTPSSRSFMLVTEGSYKKAMKSMVDNMKERKYN